MSVVKLSFHQKSRDSSRPWGDGGLWGPTGCTSPAALFNQRQKKLIHWSRFSQILLRAELLVQEQSCRSRSREEPTCPRSDACACTRCCLQIAIC